MKIGVTSDLHGYLPEIEDCEILFICGDISPLDIECNIDKMKVWLRRTFAQWVNNIPCDQVIMVPGNHDFVLQWLYKESENKKFYLYEPTKYKLEVLENNTCTIQSSLGEIYTIFGSPYCKIFGSFPFMESEEKLKEHYSAMPKGCDIVITHDAPKVGKYGTILEGNSKDAGNKILAQEIKLKSPKYHFFGHIHSGDHKLAKVKGYNTKFANVSYLNESYNPTNKVLYLDI